LEANSEAKLTEDKKTLNSNIYFEAKALHNTWQDIQGMIQH
jgi:hypothetical protein